MSENVRCTDTIFLNTQERVSRQEYSRDFPDIDIITGCTVTSY